MLRRLRCVSLCSSNVGNNNNNNKNQKSSSSPGMAIFQGSAPERMIRSVRAKEAAQASKRAAQFFDGGELEKAEEEWRSAVNTLKSKACGLGNDVSVLEPLNNLACAVGELGRGKEKLSLLDEHVELVKKNYGLKHPQFVVARYNRAAALGDVGRPKQMREEMKNILQLQKEILPPERRNRPNPKVARVLLGLADAYGRCGDYEERWDILAEAFPIVLSHCGEHHPQVAASYLALCDAALDLWHFHHLNGNNEGFNKTENSIFAGVATTTSESSSSSSSSSEKNNNNNPILIRPTTSQEAAKQALECARKAFSIESKVIPQTQSHLLTHSRLSLAKSRAAVSPEMKFSELAPFIGDIRHDIVRHAGDTAKLLIPVFAFSAQDAMRRVFCCNNNNNNNNNSSVDVNVNISSDSLENLCDTASAMSEMAFQVSLRHFDGEGHIETPRRLVELAAVQLGCSCFNLKNKNKKIETNEGKEETMEAKVQRLCKEAIRRLDAMEAEKDYLYREKANEMLLEISSSSSSVRGGGENNSSNDNTEKIGTIVQTVLKF